MKIKEFTYIKANGDVSNRTVVELVSPSEFVEGIDISELDVDSYVEFVKRMNELKAETDAKYAALYADFDLSRNYRRFVTSRMQDVTVEYI